VRIVAVCDAFDVMINGRPYKKPLSVEEALLELKRCAGTQFDPKVVELFVELAKKDPAFIQEILEQ
jgi:HD-GYP domain-containing protein (c-di-GMP phosphodiesterase class II)